MGKPIVIEIKGRGAAKKLYDALEANERLINTNPLFKSRSPKPERAETVTTVTKETGDARANGR
jgi:hypothetical protein